MAAGQGSVRELATAAGIMAGRSITQSMRDAGYSEGYARTQAGKVEARLRDLGLLPTPEDGRDLVARMRRVVIEEDAGVGIDQAFRVLLSRAKSGDAAAMKLLLEYLAGKPSQPVALTGASGGPVETVTEIIVRWPGDPDPDDPDH